LKSRVHLTPTAARLLTQQFAQILIASLAAFTAVYLLADVFDRFDDIVHYDRLGHFGVLEYLALKIPLIVSQLLPAACLAAVLVGFALLNRNGEVLAFQELGFSRAEIALPVLFAAALISIGDFAFSETVVPLTTRKARSVYTSEIKKSEVKAVVVDRNVWMRVRDGFLSADAYDSGKKTLLGITVFHLGANHRLGAIYKIQRAEWDGYSWQLTRPAAFKVHSDGAVTSGVSGLLLIDANPGDFSLAHVDPEEFSLAELNSYIASLRKKGLDPGGYLVDRDLKYALPLSCLIMVALGVALSLDPLPRRLSLGRSFGLGIALGAGYWLILGISSSFGRSGLLTPWIAAWGPNALFAMLASASFLFGEQH
jgi:lipopolysaccharide export system permease protein